MYIIAHGARESERWFASMEFGEYRAAFFESTSHASYKNSSSDITRGLLARIPYYSHARKKNGDNTSHRVHRDKIHPDCSNAYSKVEYTFNYGFYDIFSQLILFFSEKFFWMEQKNI